jgi:hypothetical protein
MALLGLCMLSGYRRGAASDELLGEYNPVGSGAWSGDSREKALLATIGAKLSAAMDAILTADQAPVSYWQT